MEESGSYWHDSWKIIGGGIIAVYAGLQYLFDEMTEFGKEAYQKISRAGRDRVKKSDPPTLRTQPFNLRFCGYIQNTHARNRALDKI